MNGAVRVRSSGAGAAIGPQLEHAQEQGWPVRDAAGVYGVASGQFRAMSPLRARFYSA
ncbi:hypothetical protein [Corallococcus exercitus]|uniref:hypothetical protein n=1 Tax=Corallococcus exercitus TaxID=2316736 RepID=UPI001ABFDA91|nr:hypothetical protein [Corallococcus exercitus]